jgi:mono/diheme cytochrome c family protein
VTNFIKTLALVAFAVAVTTGCRGETSAQPPLVPERNMYMQQRYNPQSRSHFFEDGRSMRKPPEHTFAQEMKVESEIADGELPDGSGYVMTIPQQVVSDFGGMDKVVNRGQQRFNIYCAPCHDMTGSGKGMVVQRGMAPPPTFHDDRIRHMPDGQMFATISHGVRNMPPYNYSIPVNDRWAIVSYVRALEISQAGEQ